MLRELYKQGNEKQKRTVVQWLNVVNKNNYYIEHTKDSYNIKVETLDNNVAEMEENVISWLVFTKNIEQVGKTYNWV